MVYICKNSCKIGNEQAMINIKPSIAYMVANRCGSCSDQKESVWFLKWVDSCCCCGSALRRKSKHSFGRAKVTEYINNKTEFINSKQII